MFEYSFRNCILPIIIKDVEINQKSAKDSS